MTNTRDRILELRTQNPTVTAAEMGRIIGVKRQRISQLLPKLGLTTSFVKEVNKCVDCGSSIANKSVRCRACFNKMGWLKKRCATCRKIVRVSKSNYEYRVKNGKYSGDVYCDRPCFYARNKKGSVAC